ncbi:Vacuolar protein sorting-associated protein 62 [Corchorus capsularis]|uniref:Vacuolar protein sorting-associated protein 62 n=1 Tax=Corchorus capsularis TaxID=210143 RepID=A0A1R3IQJ8_COCAP|nr:Vacuolar protein sorting-associated protein 62 [Corchorus capsularis]
MGNCLTTSSAPSDISKKKKASPIETVFKLPSPLPTWPPGEGFASGTIDLGGIQVCQISSFTKIWATHEGGPDNLGATFFEPSSIPTGFHMLGCYAQPNNTLLFGWVLAAKDETNGTLLKQPIDYNLVWSSDTLKINQDGTGYIWFPIAPEGYQALGHVITNTQNKPSLDKVRCVRSDFTDQTENYTWIWGPEHSGGSWVEASELEFQGGNNKPVSYSSLSGHAMYAKPGLVLQGSGGIGIRNDTAKSKKVLDTGLQFSIVAAEYLGSAIVEPPWINYLRKWGPKIEYDLADEIKKVEKLLPGKLKSAFEKFVKSLPNEVLGEEGPTGPKVKRSWNGDEV